MVVTRTASWTRRAAARARSAANRRLLCAVALLATFAVAHRAAALPPAEKNWEIDVNLYGWLTSISATVQAGDVSTDIDEGFFSDILGDLGWGVMGGVEGRYERALFLVDVFGSQLVSDVTGSPRTQPLQVLGNGPGGDLTVGGYDVHTRLTTWFVDVKPGFRVLSKPIHELFGGPEDPADRRRLDVDLLAGMRYWNVTNKTGIEIDPASASVAGRPVQLPSNLGDRFGLGSDVHVPSAFLGGVDQAKQETVDWVDPLVGLRITAGITQRFSVFVMGDVGGWGIGNASDLTWQVMGGPRFALSDRVTLFGGYRYLKVDRGTAFESGSLYGPQFGAEIRF